MLYRVVQTARVCFALLAGMLPVFSTLADMLSCGGGAQCFAERGIDLIRHAGDLHADEPTSTLLSASTIEAALGNFDASRASLPDAGAKTAGYNTKPLFRARALGRLALAEGIAQRQAEAERDFGEAAEILKQDQFGGPVFELSVIDVANDLLILGRDKEALSLIATTPRGWLSLRPNSPFFASEAMGQLAATAYQLGNQPLGDRLIALGKHAADGLKNETHHSLALGGLAVGLSAGECFDDALAMAESIEPTTQPSKGFALDYRTVRYAALGQIAARLVKRGKYAEAFGVAKTTPGDAPAIPPIRSMLFEMAEKGAAASQLDLLKAIDSWAADLPKQGHEDLDAALGAAWIRAGDPKKGNAYLIGVIAVANQAGFGGSQLGPFYVAWAANGYAAAGDIERATQLIADNLPRGTKRIERWGALRDIALSAIRQGKVDVARQLIASEDQGLQDAVLHGWSNIEADEHHYAEAERIAGGIRSEEELGESLVDIAARIAFSSSPTAPRIVFFRDEYTQSSMFLELHSLTAVP